MAIQRLRECISSKPISTKSKTESVLIEGKEVNAKKWYTFRIWECDPSKRNANGRSYSKVIPLVEKNKEVTTWALANHPEDDVNVKDICGVWKNPRVIDGWLCADLGFTDDDLGRKFESILELDGELEISSSVLGELDDESFVIEEGFVLERLGDVVWNSSNRLLQSKKDVYERDDETNELSKKYESGVTTINDKPVVEDDEELENSMEENKKVTILNNSNVKLHRDNALEENIKEKSMENNELLETTLSLNVKSMIKDAKNTENLNEKKSALETAYSYASKLSDKTLSEEINSELANVNNELKKLSEKGMKVDEMKDSIKSLKEEKAFAKKENVILKKNYTSLKEKYDVLSKMYEDKQFKASETELTKNHNLSKEVCSLKLKLRKQEQELRETKAKANIYKEKAIKAVANANGKADASLVEKMSKEIENLKEENRSLRKSLQKFRMSTLETKDDDSEKTSRFAMAKRNVMENRKPNENPKSSVVESKKGLSEDDKMEMMLGL